MRQPNLVGAVEIIVNIKENVKKKLEETLPFIQEQIAIQKKLAKKYGDEPYRKSLHETSAGKFSAAFVVLEEAAAHIDELEKELKEQLQRKTAHGRGIELSLKFEEVSDLPEELLKELSLSDADKSEYQIRELIEELGGIASLDRLIVEIYRKSGDITKRTTLTSRLYRMSQKGLVFSVPGRKGVYSLEELTEEDAEKLIRGELPTSD